MVSEIIHVHGPRTTIIHVRGPRASIFHVRGVREVRSFLCVVPENNNDSYAWCPRSTIIHVRLFMFVASDNYDE